MACCCVRKMSLHSSREERSLDIKSAIHKLSRIGAIPMQFMHTRVYTYLYLRIKLASVSFWLIYSLHLHIYLLLLQVIFAIIQSQL